VGIPRPLFLDVEALRNIAGYAHWIPMIRVLHREYFERNLPGWHWNQIVPVLIRRKVLVINPTDPGYRQLSQGLYISSQITAVLISLEDGITKIDLLFEDQL
jgi:hypothetical protein